MPLDLRDDGCSWMLNLIYRLALTLLLSISFLPFFNRLALLILFNAIFFTLDRSLNLFLCSTFRTCILIAIILHFGICFLVLFQLIDFFAFNWFSSLQAFCAPVAFCKFSRLFHRLRNKLLALVLFTIFKHSRCDRFSDFVLPMLTGARHLIYFLLSLLLNGSRTVLSLDKFEDRVCVNMAVVSWTHCHLIAPSRLSHVRLECTLV